MMKDRYALRVQSAYCFVYRQNFVFDSEFYYCCWHRILVIFSFISPHIGIEEKRYFFILCLWGQTICVELRLLTGSLTSSWKRDEWVRNDIGMIPDRGKMKWLEKYVTSLFITNPTWTLVLNPGLHFEDTATKAWAQRTKLRPDKLKTALDFKKFFTFHSVHMPNSKNILFLCGACCT